MSSNIPITVFTGFLGAGKTSIILSLLPRLPKDYKVVLLKNEFGDIEVDSKLAKQSSLTAVAEILNGCMCCVLVGQMKTALLEIHGELYVSTANNTLLIRLQPHAEKYHPDRIIIECSGSAFPATLAFQLRELERETDGGLKLDAIITVIDAENFAGYKDTSLTAKMQASYTDLILINKWENVSERELDYTVDHLNTLNELTPKVRCKGRNGVAPNIIFGLDSKLFLEQEQDYTTIAHDDEVETITIRKGSTVDRLHREHTRNAEGGCKLNGMEVTEEKVLTNALVSLDKETVWRVKGLVRLEKGVHIVNWAFGRYELTKIDEDMSGTVMLTVMGERGVVKVSAQKLAVALGTRL